MKKISLMLLGSLAVMNVMAQDTQSSSSTTTKDYKPLRTEMSKKVRFGLQGGLNMAKFYFSGMGDGIETTMKGSFYGGAFVNIPLGILRIQPGVMWNGMGSKWSTGAGTAQMNYEQDLHYITVPVMLQIEPGHNGFFIEAGPYISYLTTAKLQVESAGSQTPDMYNKADFDRTDFGVAGGLGYVTRIGLGFTARYVNGFTNVIKDDNSSSNNGEVLRNRAWQFGLVYHFGAAK